MQWMPRIGDKRREKGFLQKYVADKIAVTPQTLSDWERGKYYPSADKLFDLAFLLNCKVDDLYERNSDDDKVT